jgi:tRNA(adenine34) deaminase
MDPTADENFMRVALEQAKRAVRHDDVPVGAALVLDNRLVASASNERELQADPTAHAEIVALRRGAEALGSRRLEGSTLYVTLEPCSMCAGALVLARVARLVYGPQDPRAGAAYSLYNIVQDPRLNHELEVTTGVLAEESTELLQAFFEKKRWARPI